MRKIIILMLLCLVLSFVSAQDVPSIQVETAYTNPYPIEPGRSFELGLEVNNAGDEEADNVLIELKPVSPFTSLEETKVEISKLYAGDSRIFEFKLYVDSSAVSAEYEIPVEISYGTYHEHKFEKKIKLRVQGVPKFKLLDMKAEGDLEPGSKKEITVKIKNVGTGEAKRITLTLSIASEYIQPVFSKGMVYVERMKPNEEKEVSFEVFVDPDAEFGVYNGVLTISYEDESGNDLIENFSVGILVSGEPKLEIIKTEIEEGELKIEISNEGSAEARGLKAYLIIGNRTFDVDYLTSIKIDRHSNLRFNLPPVQQGLLKLEYEGPDGKLYKQEEFVSWRIEAKGGSGWIVVAVIIVVIGVVAWRKLKRK